MQRQTSESTLDEYEPEYTSQLTRTEIFKGSNYSLEQATVPNKSYPNDVNRLSHTCRLQEKIPPTTIQRHTTEPIHDEYEPEYSRQQTRFATEAFQDTNYSFQLIGPPGNRNPIDINRISHLQRQRYLKRWKH